MKRLRFLQAPFSFFGGKASMLGEIFRLLPSGVACGTFVDAFTCGGSVAREGPAAHVSPFRRYHPESGAFIRPSQRPGSGPFPEAPT